jgi:hypothetical protein
MKNSKKCLLIQNVGESDVISDLSSCQYCKKKFSKSNITGHLSICKVKNQIINEQLERDNEQLKIEVVQLKIEYEKNIQNLKIYIAKLETKCDIYREYRDKYREERDKYREDCDIMGRFSLQQKIRTNNKNNLVEFDIEIIKDRFLDVLSNIVPSDLYDGQIGIGRLIATCIKNDDDTTMFTCTDYSRNVFTYKDDQGNLNKDIKCKRLAKIIEPIASAKALEILEGAGKIQNKYIKISELKQLIRSRERDIDIYGKQLSDQVHNTEQWNKIDKLITELHTANAKDMVDITDLEEEINDAETGDNCICVAKLLDGMNDIKEMRNDSTKFSKAVSEHI